MSFISELKRRNVFKVATVYLITSWLILQIVSVISPALHLPTVFSTIITVLLAIGFPVACIFAWAFELTPEGLKYSHEVDEAESIRHETGSKINYMLAVALLLALGFISYDKWNDSSADDSLERSIAVLPFQDMSSDKSQGYFGDGISEEILNTLARLKQLVVIARTSSFNFRDSKADIREIGRLLNVNYVLEGSVRKDKDNVRITAQLIEVDSGAHIWSQTYDRELTNIFALQDELTYAITQALKLNLLPDELAVETGMTSSSKAYELFLQGRENSYHRTTDSLQQAARLLNEAIGLDENFHLAKAQLYFVYSLAQFYGGFAIEQIELEQERLFWELLTAPSFPLKTLVIAKQAENNSKYDIANSAYMLAFNQAPNDPLIQNISLLALDDINVGLELREQILRTNPQSEVNISNLIYGYFISGRIKEAKDLVEMTNQQFPDSPLNYGNNIFNTYGYDKNLPAMISIMKQYNGPVNYDVRNSIAAFYVLIGDIDASLTYVAKELRENADYEEQLYFSLLLLQELYMNGKMDQNQRLSFDKLPITKTTKLTLLALNKLLVGDETHYEIQNDLTGLSAKEFVHKVELNTYEPYLYAALKKSKGDDRYAQAILPILNKSNILCGKAISGAGWPCAIYFYLRDGESSENIRNMLNRNVLFDGYSIGIEKNLLTFPSLIGMGNDPDFKKRANEILDKTFRKWNPDLVSEHP